GVCEGRRADAIPIRASHRGQTRYIRSPAASRRAVGAGEVPRSPGVQRSPGSRARPPSSARTVLQGLGAAAQPPAPSPPDLRAELRARGRCHAERSEPVRRGPRPGPGWPLAGRSRAPLAFSDAGPHVHYGWGESVRLRHLYTAGPQGLYSCFLRIHSDGAVDCAQVQSAHSLMEIRAVALSTVAIKGERSVLYLCMDADGKMQGLTQYSAEDCAFEEEIRPDGYNVYWSRKHHLPVS
uniref:Fibroblast growth factor n=1 Tax=Bos mutus grunniens TaxID=30521 RepID=A0A8B9YJU5_BOSMU